MKKRCLLIVISFLILVGPAAWGGEVLKIGYVDLQKALNLSEKGKVAKQAFQEEVERVKADLDARQNALKALRDEIEKQGLVLSEEARKAKQKDYQEKLREFQRFYQDSQEELQTKDAELTKKILGTLQEVIGQLGEEQGYTLILEKNESSILYGAKAVDLTDEVIRRYNQKQ